MRGKIKPPKAWVIAAFLGPIVIWYAYVAIVPIFTATYYSLFNWKGGQSMSFVGLKNYAQLMADNEFWRSAKNNLIIVLLCTAGQVGIALLISFALVSRNLRFKELHRTIIFFPVVVSALVIGFIWSIMYNSSVGLINRMLTAMGLERWIQLWLDDPRIVIYTVSLPAVLQYVGLYMIMFMGAIHSIPDDIYESAYLDGASEWQKSMHITLPMIYPTFKVAVMICVSGTMKIFDHILVMTNGGPGKASQVLALYAYNVSFDKMKLSYGSTIAMATLVMSFILTVASRTLLGGKRYE